jgi:hypothetical protein
MSSLFLGRQPAAFFRTLMSALERALLSQVAIVDNDLLVIIETGGSIT